MINCASFLFLVLVGSAVLIAGHVTKSGEVAGPRILEHMVDTGMFALMSV